MSALLWATHLTALLGGLVVGDRLRRGLARRRLNEALHELRRPLQAVALAPAGECRRAWMAQVAAALADLDATINGGPARGRADRVALSGIVEDARRRWAPLAEIEFATGLLDERLRDCVLLGDRPSLGAALDNLIANAVEHGCGPVRVEASGSPSRVRLEVINGQGDRGPALQQSDARRGHGLRAGERVASEHGGRLVPPASEPGSGATRAALELPGVAG